MTQTDFMFGAGRSDITPPLGKPMAGFANRTQGAEGVISPLCATAFVLELGDVRTAFISVDVIGIGRDDSAAIRKAVAAVTHADPQRIVLATTHTHSGPVTTFFRIAQPEPTYMAQLTDGIVAAARDAVKTLTPARMEFVVTQAPEFHTNRRNADLPIDSTLSVLRFVSDNDTTLGAWVNYGCHPTILGGENMKWSADYVGFMRDTIEAPWPGTVGFFNGCHGDVNGAMSGRLLSEAQRIGRGLGEKVLGLDERFTRVVVDRLEGGSTMVAVPLATALSIDELQRIAAGQGGTPYDIPWAKVQLDRYHAGKKPITTTEVEFQWFRVGDVFFACFPGQLFGQLGLDLREKWSDDRLWIINQCNDHAGYFPSVEGFERGGYEATSAYRFNTDLPAPMTPKAGEAMINEALKH